MFLYVTYDLSPAEVGPSEAFRIGGAFSLGILDTGSVLDQGERHVAFFFPSRRVLFQAHEGFLGLVMETSSDCIPGGFGSEVDTDEEGDRPDPLDGERESPSEISLNVYDSTHYTG